MKAVAKPGQIVPVDSEHAALFQALLRRGPLTEVRKLVVTASGGPFRGRTKAELAAVTPADALAHPTWSMGPVITVNSATLVNKGLEVIEAHLLYDVPFDRIEVVVHPQSYVHSMVEFTDGSTLAQATPPDMRGPIAIGLGWPERVPDAARRVRLVEGIDLGVLPAGRGGVPLGRPGPARRHPGRHGTGGVQAPRTRSAWTRSSRALLPFNGIVDTVAEVVAEHGTPAAGTSLTLPDVLEAEAWARTRAVNWRPVRPQRPRRPAHDDTDDGPRDSRLRGGPALLDRLARAGPPLHGQDVRHPGPAVHGRVRADAVLAEEGATPSTASRPSRWAATSA
ncbi:hypothetical protein GCM10020221_03680 [Streptomyces thioluteus]|uniref:1-deoxy-D-xylulose-5-phosphate reductoisomerase n=1 Tax=Streptomyces thioluteus TaxID=66431 RepID=A0ABN3WDR4_STRTU